MIFRRTGNAHQAKCGSASEDGKARAQGNALPCQALKSGCQYAQFGVDLCHVAIPSAVGLQAR
jgi:hypothetical protein